MHVIIFKSSQAWPISAFRCRAAPTAVCGHQPWRHLQQARRAGAPRLLPAWRGGRAHQQQRDDGDNQYEGCSPQQQSAGSCTCCSQGSCRSTHEALASATASDSSVSPYAPKLPICALHACMPTFCSACWCSCFALGFPTLAGAGLGSQLDKVCVPGSKSDGCELLLCCWSNWLPVDACAGNQ